jgi:hypothetical protein
MRSLLSISIAAVLGISISPLQAKRQRRRSRRTTCLDTVVVLGITIPMFAQAAAPKLPRLNNGRPNFTGIWQTTSAADYDLEPHAARKDAPPGAGIVAGGVIPYLPAALEKRKKNFAARLSADPRLKYWTLGTPRGIYYPEPFQIFQRDRDLTLVFQFGHSVRTIHTNNTRHPKETDNEFWLGDSREVPDRYRAVSPSQHVRAQLPPTFVAYGEHDHLVPPILHIQMGEKLRPAGVPHRIVGVPYSDHDYDVMWGSLGGQITRGMPPRNSCSDTLPPASWFHTRA